MRYQHTEKQPHQSQKYFHKKISRIQNLTHQWLIKAWFGLLLQSSFNNLMADVNEMTYLASIFDSYLFPNNMTGLRLKINIVTFRLLNSPQPQSRKYLLLTNNSVTTNTHALSFNYGLLSQHLSIQHYLNITSETQKLELVLVDSKHFNEEVGRAQLDLNKMSIFGLQRIKMFKGQRVIATLELFLLLLQASVSEQKDNCQPIGDNKSPINKDIQSKTTGNKREGVHVAIQTEQTDDQLWQKSLIAYTQKLERDNSILLQQIESFEEQKQRLAEKIQSLQRKITIVELRLQKYQFPEMLNLRQHINGGQQQAWLQRKSELALSSFDEPQQRWSQRAKCINRQSESNKSGQLRRGYLQQHARKEGVPSEVSPLLRKESCSLSRCFSKWSNIQTTSSVEQYL